jgi:hypothetical protein
MVASPSAKLGVFQTRFERPRLFHLRTSVDNPVAFPLDIHMEYNLENYALEP